MHAILKPNHQYSFYSNAWGLTSYFPPFPSFFFFKYPATCST
jgi:hypothetical protein